MDKEVDQARCVNVLFESIEKIEAECFQAKMNWFHGEFDCRVVSVECLVGLAVIVLLKEKKKVTIDTICHRLWEWGADYSAEGLSHIRLDHYRLKDEKYG